MNLITQQFANKSKKNMKYVKSAPKIWPGAKFSSISLFGIIFYVGFKFLKKCRFLNCTLKSMHLPGTAPLSRRISIFFSHAAALISSAIFGQFSLPIPPVQLKFSPKLNPWNLPMKRSDGTDLTSTGYTKYICGNRDAVIDVPEICTPMSDDIGVK